MKKRLVNFIRIALAIALAFGWLRCMRGLIGYHFACCPELYDAEMNRTLSCLPLLGVFGLSPLPLALAGHWSGYQLHKIHWFFLEITKPDKLRIRLTKKLGFGTRMLPPRTDGTSPYMFYWLSGYIYMAAVTLLLGLLTAIFWRFPAARYLNIWFCAMVMTLLAPLLPTKVNSLDRVLAFRKSRDLRRAWECAQHTAAAIEQNIQLQDMPEEWFLPYPTELLDHPIVQVNNFNRASRLINQDRWAEGYEALRYFFALEPKPGVNMLIAGAIINGAQCEALADLKPMCLSQLDHPALKLPMPPDWERPRLFAEYARALFLHHDNAEAAAILPKLMVLIEKEGKGRITLERMQEKAGILPAAEGENA